MITRAKIADLPSLHKLLVEVKTELATKASNEKIDELLNEIRIKDEKISSLEARVEILESQVAVCQRTVNLLERKVDLHSTHVTTGVGHALIIRKGR